MTATRAPRARTRCAWPGLEDPTYTAYHDTEWGVPSFDDRHLFEKLILEGAQAGLSWLTILRKREAYRRAYRGFDPATVARFGAADVRRMLADAGLVRNRLKIESSIRNARAFLAVQEEHGRFATFLWSFVEGRTQVNAWRTHREMPVTTPISDALSKALKRRGFSFVGSTMMYAYMQSVGMVNDHLVSCFRYRETVAQAASGKGPKRPAGRRTTR